MGDKFFSFAVLELGYGEWRIDKELSWSTGWPSLVVAVGMACFTWWLGHGTSWWVYLVLKFVCSAISVWTYIHWLNPLLYESVAVKQGRALEVCTRWKHFEDAVVVPIKDLLAVTLQEVPNRTLVLTFKLRNETSMVAFENTHPGWETHLEVLSMLAALLPRQLVKRKAVSLLREPVDKGPFEQWLQRSNKAERAFAGALWSALSAGTQRQASAAYFAALREFNRLRHSEQLQQRLRPWLDAAQVYTDALRPWLKKLLPAARVVGSSCMAVTAAAGCVALHLWRSLYGFVKDSWEESGAGSESARRAHRPQYYECDFAEHQRSRPRATPPPGHGAQQGGKPAAAAGGDGSSGGGARGGRGGKGGGKGSKRGRRR